MLQTNLEGEKRVTRNTVAVIDSECKNEMMEVAAELKRETKTRAKKGAEGNANKTFVVEESDMETSDLCLDRDDGELVTSPSARSRTKVIVKSSKDVDEKMEQLQPEVQPENEIPPAQKRTRSKALRKKTDSQSSEDEVVARSRTKVLRKGVEPVVVSETATALKEPLSTKGFAESPASLKG